MSPPLDGRRQFDTHTRSADRCNRRRVRLHQPLARPAAESGRGWPDRIALSIDVPLENIPVAEFPGPPDFETPDGVTSTFRLDDGTLVRFEERKGMPAVVTHLAAGEERGPGVTLQTFCR